MNRQKNKGPFTQSDNDIAGVENRVNAFTGPEGPSIKDQPPPFQIDELGMPRPRPERGGTRGPGVLEGSWDPMASWVVATCRPQVNR